MSIICVNVIVFEYGATIKIAFIIYKWVILEEVLNGKVINKKIIQMILATLENFHLIFPMPEKYVYVKLYRIIKGAIL